MNIDLTTKTVQQLITRLDQLQHLAQHEPEAGRLFTDIFAEQFEVQREVNLIFIEITRRQARTFQ